MYNWTLILLSVKSNPDLIHRQSSLKKLGDICLKERQLGYAAKAFELSGDKGKLNVLGDTCLREGLIGTALKAYTLSQNEMMINFIKENFGNQIWGA